LRAAVAKADLIAAQFAAGHQRGYSGGFDRSGNLLEFLFETDMPS
jgi:hypothetical protein